MAGQSPVTADDEQEAVRIIATWLTGSAPRWPCTDLSNVGSS
jgi:hypothetical protein